MFLANFDEGTSPWRSAASVEEIVAGGDALSKLVQDGIERIAGEHAELADLIDDWQHKRASGTLRVTGLRWRELTFYRERPGRPRPCLLGICLEAVDDGPAADATDPQPSRPPRRLRLFYVLRRPGTDGSGGTAAARLGDAASNGSRAGQQASSEALQPAVHLFHLDGTSPPIHELNAKEGGIELTGGRLEANAVDYCDFFCQFVAGEEGPFTMLRRPQDLVWAEWARDQKIGSQVFEKRRLEGLRRELRPQSSHQQPEAASGKVPETYSELREHLSAWVSSVNLHLHVLPLDLLGELYDLDPAEAALEDGAEPRTAAAQFTELLLPKRGEQPAAGQSERRPTPKLLELGTALRALVEPVKSTDDARVALRRLLDNLNGLRRNGSRPVCLIAAIQYGPQLFLALMTIQSTGMIEMTEDNPLLAELGGMPIGRMRFSTYPQLAGLSAMSEVAPKAPSSKSARDQLVAICGVPQSLAAFSIPPGGQQLDPTTVEPVEIVGAEVVDDLMTVDRRQRPVMDFSARTLAQPVRIENVVFLGDIILENTTVEGSLRFVDCRILGQVRMRETTIKGSLAFDNCTVVGLPAHARGVASARHRAEEDGKCICLDSATIEGDLDLLNSTLEGDVSISRTNVRGKTRFSGTTVEPLRDTSSEGGVELSPRFVGGAIGVDLRHSRLERGLEISANFASSVAAAFANTRTAKPTIIVGSLLADHLVIAGGLRLAGLVVSTLPEVASRPGQFTGISFRAANVEGGIALWQSSTKATGTWRHARTIIVGAANFEDCSVGGDADLRGLWVDGDLTASWLKCSGSVALNSLRQPDMDFWTEAFPPLVIPTRNGKPLVKLPSGVLNPQERPTSGEVTIATFGRTHIEGGLSLRGAVIDNRAILNGCYIGRRIDCREAKLGTLSCGLSVSPYSGTMLRDLHVGATPAWWRAFKAETTASERDQDTATHDGSRSAGASEIERDVVHYISARNPNTIIFKHVDMSGSELDGLLIMRTEAADLMLRDASIRGRLDCTGLWLTDGSDREETPSNERTAFQSLAHNARELHRLIGSKQPVVDPTGLKDNPAGIRSSTAQRLLIENVHVDGPVLFNDRDFCELWARELSGIEAWNMFRIIFGERGTWTFDPESRPLGVDLEVADWLRKQLPSDVERTWVDGMAVIRNTTIEGQLDVTGAVVAGTLEVVDVDLKSDFVAVHCHSEIEKGRRDRAGEPSADHALRPRPVHTVANEVDLEMLRCEGDVLLSGLVARNRLKARHMEAKGIVQFLYDGQRSSDEPGLMRDRQPRFCAAYVGGRVDLTGSQIGWLRSVSYDLAKSPGDCDADHGCWVLDRANVQRLDFWEPFPARIDMRGMASQRISAPGDRTEYLMRVLARQQPFSTEPYALVQRLLRARGQPLHANRVFKRMNWKSAFNAFSGANWLGKVMLSIAAPFWLAIWALPTAFGIGWGRLVALGLTIVLAAFALVASHPDNWDPPALRALAREYAQSVRPSSDEPISCSQAILKAAEIAIPMIALSPRDNASDPKLKENGGTSFNLSFACPGDPTRPSEVPAFRTGISPAGLAGILSFLGWIVWPLLFLAFSGFMRRE